MVRNVLAIQRGAKQITPRFRHAAASQPAVQVPRHVGQTRCVRQATRSTPQVSQMENNALVKARGAKPTTRPCQHAATRRVQLRRVQATKPFKQAARLTKQLNQMESNALVIRSGARHPQPACQQLELAEPELQRAALAAARHLVPVTVQQHVLKAKHRFPQLVRTTRQGAANQ